jgi:hypothetical protein
MYERGKRMKGEINKDFYCSVRAFVSNGANNDQCEYGYEFSRRCKYGKDGCEFFHRKHPTPEQFKEEYGEEVPINFPVWFIVPEDETDSFCTTGRS